MCPACIASAAIMVSGAGTTGGILAACLAKFMKCFQANGLKSVSNKQGGTKWQQAIQKNAQR